MVMDLAGWSKQDEAANKSLQINRLLHVVETLFVGNLYRGQGGLSSPSSSHNIIKRNSSVYRSLTS